MNNEPVVSLTPSAVTAVQEMLTRETGSKALRVYVESGGCSGMQYRLVFDEQREKDLANDCGGVLVVVDEFSAGYLRGVVVDFSDALTDSGFKISNPNAKQNCGCGKSFGV